MKKSLSLIGCFLFVVSICINAQAPAITWQKSLGGSGPDQAYAIKQTTDGGYIVFGNTYSNDGDVSGNQGYFDFWVVKTNAGGVIQWQKCLGNSGLQEATSVQQTSDGGYIVAGNTSSGDAGDVTGTHGDQDYWIVKLNSTGVIQWQKSLGGTYGDYANAIQQTTDGGYIVAGSTTSNNGDVSGNHGFFQDDAWIVKLNSTGSIQWQKCLGGANREVARAIKQTTDGGYIVACSASSNDGDVSVNRGLSDYWVVKLNSTGTIQWQKSVGGSGSDDAASIDQTADGGYVVAGYSTSNNGDVSLNHGYEDYWVVKLNSIGTAIEWQKCFGGINQDRATSVHQTTDAGFIVAGYTSSNDGDVTGYKGQADYWIIKLSNTGTLQWQKTLGGASMEEAQAVEQTSDGGYIIAGRSVSTDGDVTGNHGGFDFWVVKLGLVVNTNQYFRTRQSGNWNDINTWEFSPVSDFSSGVISPATQTPDFNSNTITIQNGHTVTVTANVTVDQTIVNNGGAITINNGSTLFITDGAGFDITVNGTVTVQTGGGMTIKSGISGSASVGTSAGTISGNVTVERYIPDIGHRALRLLNAPTTGTQTIRDAWQEGGASVNNLGTQITSPLYNGSNGFDATSPISSIFIHNQAAPAGTSWRSLPVTNTNATRLDSQLGYLLLVYGDRNATPSNSLHDATTLRSSGTLRQGTQPAVTVSSAGTGYTLTGNPYASPIDFETIAGTANLAQYYYMYDANLTGRLNIGGFRLVERTGVNTYQHTPVLGGVPTIDNTMRYIHSGQAFLLKTTGANASVVFTEASKTALLPGVNPFRTSTTEQQLLANLFVVATDTTALADGIRVRFDNAWSAAVTPEDITKMNNFSENLASRRDNNLLIVEKRSGVIANDTIYLNISDMNIKNYRLRISGENMPVNMLAYVQDNFTNTQTTINLNSFTNVDFSVTLNPASSAADRFKIVLRVQGALPIKFSSVKAYQQGSSIAVEWVVHNEEGIKHYEVEKSTDGRNFSKAVIQAATGNNIHTVNYSWVDVNATTGNNFYRISSTALDGDIKYSQVVKVTIGKGKAGYEVYPNPVISNVINLQFINQPKGMYSIRLLNLWGQVMFTKQILHNGGSSAEAIELSNIKQKGHYVLEVSGADKNKRSVKIIY